jgi:hypothetical protein
MSIVENAKAKVLCGEEITRKDALELPEAPFDKLGYEPRFCND